MKNYLTLAAVIGACALATGCASNLSGQALTDRAIHQDLQAYEAQQAQLKSVNDTGKHRLGSYSMAKAQCWLDVSLHEYSRNDRSDFPKLAHAESVKIAEYLKQGGDASASANPAMATPMLNDAAKLRPDLWSAAAQLKTHAGWSCAEQKVACAEVELVHAGHEFNQQQWRHAQPYIQMAENLIADAQKAAAACVPAPAPVVARAAPAPVAVVASPAPVVPVNATANVLFNFDKRDLGNVRSYTKDQLDGLIAQVKSGSITVKSIRLIGHADRLNSTGDTHYNTKISQDRVETIRAYMVGQGVPSNLISTDFKADGQQIEACTKAKFRSNAELQECLLPNRRVEVLLSGVRK